MLFIVTLKNYLFQQSTNTISIFKHFFILQYGDLYNINQQAFEKALEKEGEEEDNVCNINCDSTVIYANIQSN